MKADDNEPDFLCGGGFAGAAGVFSMARKKDTERIAELERELKRRLPLNGRGKCFYCDSCQQKPDGHLFHFDQDNNPVACLDHPDNAKAKALLNL